jgi:hypothetical protein
MSNIRFESLQFWDFLTTVLTNVHKPNSQEKCLISELSPCNSGISGPKCTLSLHLEKSTLSHRKRGISLRLTIYKSTTPKTSKSIPGAQEWNSLKHFISKWILAIHLDQVPGTLHWLHHLPTAECRLLYNDLPKQNYQKYICCQD